jgi:hypothetical protein
VPIDLEGYIPVNQRIDRFYELYAAGSIVTERVFVTSEPDGVPRVWCKALAYRTADDPHPGVGWSWMVLPGSTNFTRGSELENTETSAWGRAIASLGILIDKSIASQNEVDNKAEEAPVAKAAPPKGEHEELLGDLGRKRTGTIVKTKSRGSDLEARQTPDGTHIGFKLETAKGAIEEVWAVGEYADFLFSVSSMDLTKLEGEKVTVDGLLYRVTEANRKTKHRLKLHYVEVLDAFYPPAPHAVPDAPGATETNDSPALAPEDQAELDALPWPDTTERTPA